MCAHIDAIRTIDPPVPWEIICRPTAEETRNEPVAFISSTRRQEAGGYVSALTGALDLRQH
jgi:hypothetical protein